MFNYFINTFLQGCYLSFPKIQKTRTVRLELYTCLTQLYDGKDMYLIYYIKNNYMFRHFSLAFFNNLKMANEKCRNM